MKSRSSKKGFTLIELMIVVAVLSILALIAMPYFAGIIRKSKEAGTKGHLGSIRSAILLYYMENDQVFPSVYAALIQPNKKYINEDCLLYTGAHDDSSVVDDMPDVDPASDVGRWGFVVAGPDIGHFYIQCTHTDTSGVMWSKH